MMINNAMNMYMAHEMGQVQKQIINSFARIASGSRINSAADDPSGLVISERLKAQVNEANMRARNSADEIGALKTAEGNAANINNSLQKMRELSVYASNGTLTAQDRMAIQEQVNQLGADIGYTPNVATQSSAMSSISQIDDELASVNSFRSSIGSTINSLNTKIENYGTTSMNLDNSRSIIEDADIAAEAMNINNGINRMNLIMGAYSKMNQMQNDFLVNALL